MQEFNVCLIPNKKIQQTCIKLSQEISQQYQTNFILNHKNPIPHISIYHIGIPTKNKNKLFNLVENISKTHQPFKVKSKNFFQFDNFFFINTNISNSFIRLHNNVVDTLNPLREGFLRNEIKEFINNPNVSQQRKKYAQKYGYFLVKNEFIPHITITNFLNRSDIKQVIKKFNLPKFSFIADKIFITKIGPYGTVSKIIKEYRLK